MTAVFVASSGGHLTQLHHLRPRLKSLGDVRWVTFDTPQTRSLLQGEDVVFVEHTGTRDYRHVMTNGMQAARLLRDGDVSAVVSTGAAIALSFLPLARTFGVPAHYIESATRSTGPSTTGRLLARVPGLSLYSQHRAWARGRWNWGGSVFEGFTARQRRFPTQTIRKAVVTLGAHEGFGFRRLLDRAVELLPPETEVLWQTGVTPTDGLGIDARPFVSSEELSAAMREADVVIAHAGVGSTLSALDAGRCPILVPRSAADGEHIDNHQLEIAAELADSDVAIVRRVTDLSLDDLLEAAAVRVNRATTPPAFELRAAPAKVPAGELLPAPSGAIGAA